MKPLIATLVFVVGIAATANALEYRAAVKEQNITPCPPSFGRPCGDRIEVLQEIRTTGGAALQAAGVDLDSDNTPSELLVRALVVEDATGNRIAIVGIDLLGLDRDFVRSVKLEIVKNTGIPPRMPLNCNGLQLRQTPACLSDAPCTSAVILSEAKDLKIRNLRSFAVFAAQDDGARMPLN
jgi:hypothetical protein